MCLLHISSRWSTPQHCSMGKSFMIELLKIWPRKSYHRRIQCLHDWWQGYASHLVQSSSIACRRSHLQLKNQNIFVSGWVFLEGVCDRIHFEPNVTSSANYPSHLHVRCLRCQRWPSWQTLSLCSWWGGLITANISKTKQRNCSTFVLILIFPVWLYFLLQFIWLTEDSLICYLLRKAEWCRTRDIVVCKSTLSTLIAKPKLCKQSTYLNLMKSWNLENAPNLAPYWAGRGRAGHWVGFFPQVPKTIDKYFYSFFSLSVCICALNKQKLQTIATIAMLNFVDFSSISFLILGSVQRQKLGFRVPVDHTGRKWCIKAKALSHLWSPPSQFLILSDRERWKYTVIAPLHKQKITNVTLIKTPYVNLHLVPCILRL